MAKPAPQENALAEPGLYAEAKTAWPDIAIEEATFYARLDEARRAIDGTQTVIHVGDLYFAVACSAQVPQAVMSFETDLVPKLAVVLARTGLNPSTVEDALLAVRERVFADSLLDRYQGRGSLFSWLRVVALREAWRIAETTDREFTSDALDLVESVCVSGDTDVQLLKLRYRPLFEDAMRGAIARLSARSRNLLRHHYRDGLPVERIATMYSVHRVTASRWLSSIRDEVLADVRTALIDHAGVLADECDSLIDCLRSQLDLSINTLLESQSNPLSE